MTALPGANVRILSGKSTTPLVPRFQNFHTMVGTLAGTESHFTPSGRPYSHFGVGGGGEVRQWQDLDFRAASDLNGNPYSISWETEDHGPHFPVWSGSDVPEWTDNQLDAMANGGAWICLRYGIPTVDVLSSWPIPHGLSIHRYGIDPYRVSGGLYYSSKTGKVCPGDRRVHQFKTELVPEIRRRVLGVVEPSPPVIPEEEYIMPYPVIHCPDRGPEYVVLTPRGPIDMPGADQALNYYNSAKAVGLVEEVQTVSLATFDRAKACCAGLATNAPG